MGRLYTVYSQSISDSISIGGPFLRRCVPVSVLYARPLFPDFVSLSHSHKHLPYSMPASYRLPVQTMDVYKDVYIYIYMQCNEAQAVKLSPPHANLSSGEQTERFQEVALPELLLRVEQPQE